MDVSYPLTTQEHDMTITQRIYHSKTYKAIGGGLAALVMMTVTIGVAHAEWTPKSKVDVVWQYTYGDGYVFLLQEDEYNQCPPHGYYVIDRNGPEHETMMRILTDALISGKKVVFGYDFTDQFCRVSSVRIWRQ
jgi:hypothetical protein